MTTPAQRHQLNAFLCAACGHLATLHTVTEDGSCSACWSQVKTIGQSITICHGFVLTAEDLATAEDLMPAIRLDIALGRLQDGS